ncbi:hypothetical protein DdX_17335 [Ditylenchus destructor]|uniref:Uncharacterized protein n=1 Tax=Ditylenchus destructor TaxID=166010 RepID=A0AAD4MN61_9BILA|nr:hypothetical protein DdX_17335 [Ditylenchus destructor]
MNLMSLCIQPQRFNCSMDFAISISTLRRLTRTSVCVVRLRCGRFLLSISSSLQTPTDVTVAERIENISSH